jgi:hypothetical protein
MSVPMVAWMRRRGHGWRASGEMTGAMFVPAAVLILCYWLHVVAADAICPLACAAMLPAMATAMLYRRAEYTCHQISSCLRRARRVTNTPSPKTRNALTGRTMVWREEVAQAGRRYARPSASSISTSSSRVVVRHGRATSQVGRCYRR